MLRRLALIAIVLLLVLPVVNLSAQPILPIPVKTPTELLSNGGFETDVDGDKIPDNWVATNDKLQQRDKIKCDTPDSFVAHSGLCAFVFRGNPDATISNLTQKPDGSGLVDGTVLTFSAYIDPRSGRIGATFGRIKVVLEDQTILKYELLIPAPAAKRSTRSVADYVQVVDTFTLNLGASTVRKVVVKVLEGQKKGKFVVDDVSLTAQ